ncbi:branched-chain amino acid transporter permease [Bacterioplanoides sp.]|uniref:branched-chain amino acid transporter permease n=1 Tax=Bacterioplanoides sp. TaxID=2066072 RepID=UPI003AFF6E5C
MNEFWYLSSVIAVLAGVTFFTRVLPFVLLYKVADHPLLTYLGRFLPAMVMVLLVVYSFKNDAAISLESAPELGCLLLVAALHLAFRQSLLSIVGGTAVYMMLVQMGVG